MLLDLCFRSEGTNVLGDIHPVAETVLLTRVYEQQLSVWVNQFVRN